MRCSAPLAVFRTKSAGRSSAISQTPFGVTLAARLKEKKAPLTRFLADLRFVDAGDSRMCGQWTSAAFTEPGSLVIFVCGGQFVDRAGSLAGAAGEVVIIHEVLHALGLPENGRFLSSDEITAIVRRRCSR